MQKSGIAKWTSLGLLAAAAAITLPRPAFAQDASGCDGYAAMQGTQPQSCPIGTDTIEYAGKGKVGNLDVAYDLQCGFYPSAPGTYQANPDYHRIHVAAGGGAEKTLIHYKKWLISVVPSVSGGNGDGNINIFGGNLSSKAWACKGVDLSDLSQAYDCKSMTPWVKVEETQTYDAARGQDCQSYVTHLGEINKLDNPRLLLDSYRDQTDRYSKIDRFLKKLDIQ